MGHLATSIVISDSLKQLILAGVELEVISVLSVEVPHEEDVEVAIPNTITLNVRLFVNDAPVVAARVPWQRVWGHP